MFGVSGASLDVRAEERRGRMTGEKLGVLELTCRPGSLSQKSYLILWAAARTLAIAQYSIATDITLSPRVTKIAIFVETPSIKDMASGPTSLQKRSMRRI